VGGISGVNETLTQQGQGTGAASTSTQFSVYRLQIEDVQVSFKSPTGQTAQLQSPQNAASAFAKA
jgi:hypothetical protein